jgi:hypothetical protein
MWWPCPRPEGGIGGTGDLRTIVFHGEDVEVEWGIDGIEMQRPGMSYSAHRERIRSPLGDHLEWNRSSSAYDGGPFALWYVILDELF